MTPSVRKWALTSRRRAGLRRIRCRHDWPVLNGRRRGSWCRRHRGHARWRSARWAVTRRQWRGARRRQGRPPWYPRLPAGRAVRRPCARPRSDRETPRRLRAGRRSPPERPTAVAGVPPPLAAPLQAGRRRQRRCLQWWPPPPPRSLLLPLPPPLLLLQELRSAAAADAARTPRRHPRRTRPAEQSSKRPRRRWRRHWRPMGQARLLRGWPRSAPARSLLPWTLPCRSPLLLLAPPPRVPPMGGSCPHLGSGGVRPSAAGRELVATATARPSACRARGRPLGGTPRRAWEKMHLTRTVGAAWPL